MTENMIMAIMKDAIKTALLVSAPILITGVVVGLIVSILQATTQVQEQTLTFVPKLLAVAIVGLVTGPWMMHIMNDFTQRMFKLLANIVH